MRSQSSKQSEYIGELENKIDDVEKKNRQQSHQMQQQQNRSPTPETAGNYYDPYSRTRSTRIPRTPTSGSLSASSNPVKMVQEMVGRVRVSFHSTCNCFIMLLILYTTEFGSTFAIMSLFSYTTFESSSFI